VGEVSGATIDRSSVLAEAQGAGEPEREGRLRRDLRRHLFAYALIAPALVLLALLIAYPLVDAVYLSLNRSSFINPEPTFVGLDNYRAVLQTSTFQRVFLNSLVWTLFVVIFQFVVGIGTALLLGQRFAGRGVLRALVIIPWVMPGIIGGILWKLMYEPYLGLVNHALLSAGIIGQVVPWLARPDTVMAAVIFAAIWKGAPFSILMYTAAYQNVSQDLVEAARIDGANAWQRFVSVTLPEMTPTIRTTILLTTVWTFNYFDLIYITTRGGPGIASHIFPTYIYDLAFVKVEYGLAATYGIISVLILIVFSTLYVRELNKAEVFEA
jgi:ABC-type sugar transport system permease subunit